jgi:hypothetical protein
MSLPTTNAFTGTDRDAAVRSWELAAVPDVASTSPTARPATGSNDHVTILRLLRTARESPTEHRRRQTHFW